MLYACWWAVDEAKKVIKETPKQFINYWMVLLLAFLLIHTQLFFCFILFIPYIVYLQTVDWKMPYFYSELTLIFVIT